MKKTISAVLAGCMLFSGISAMARDINITIDGDEFIPKNVLGEEVFPFIEAGSTFLPVRAMGEAVGKEVSFDAENYAVYIGTRPMEKDAIRTPYALVGDSIYYTDEIEYVGDLNAMIEAETIVKLAEEKLNREEIEKLFNEQVEYYKNSTYMTEVGEAEKRYIYINVCAQLLIENGTVAEEDYEKFVTVKHILVTDEAVAKEIIASLDSGVAIEELIEKYNTDPGQTKDSSYTFTYQMMVKPFEEASFNLEEGAYTKEPVATDYGYHIIKRLPLDKESDSFNNIIVENIVKELEKVEVGKAFEIEATGNYGEIEGRVYTADELSALSKIIDGTAKAANGFGYVQQLVSLKKLNEEKPFITDDEVKTIIEAMGASYDTASLGENADYYVELLNLQSAAYMKFMMEELDESFEADWQKKMEELEVKECKQLKLYIDGKLIIPCDVNGNYAEPKNIEGTVYVPVRAIVEALGMKADWDNDTRTVVVTR